MHKFHSSTLSSSPSQQRYLGYIAQFTNKFDYVKGEFNVADVVSRPTEDSGNLNAILPQQERPDYLAIARAQYSDPEINLLCRTNDTSLQLVEVPLADHDFRLLCDFSRGKLRPIIPSSLRSTVFKHYHYWSHPGTRTGIKLIGDRFVWPGMRKDIAEWTRECQNCNRAKITRYNKALLAAVSPPPTERFTHIYADLIGPLVQSHGYSLGWSEKNQKIFFILFSNAIVVKICLVTVLIKVYKNFSNISYSSGAPAKLKFSNFC